MQTVFRVEQVLRGDSALVAIEGVDAREQRVRLEVDAATAGSVRPGAALVVQWWTAELPQPATPPEVVRDAAAPADAVDESMTAAEGDEPATTFDERLEREFRALIGLR
ncbi:MAG: hypothetical protein KC420_02680 [Myxococcales bacterium]|nr:hypothetical protein [Myxococcales bacterium]MCB9703215.1 hypothetical protein [Myxococcales bacterium]